MESAKRKISSFWLTHFFIRRIAKRYPDFFKKWVYDITDNRLERKTVIFRYHGDEEDKNKLGLPISTDHLCPRKRYRGYYVVPETGDPYVILLNTPCDLVYAMSSASVALADSTTEGGE